MCIVGIALNQHPDFPVIFVNNRDEDKHRPTSSFSVQSDDVLCAIDEQAGGTWFGIDTKTGHFSVVTNVIMEGLIKEKLIEMDEDSVVYKEKKFSRGELVKSAIKDGEKFFDKVKDRILHFGGFNLIWGNFFEWKKGFNFLSDHTQVLQQKPVDEIKVEKIDDGVEAISNSFRNDFSWPKCKTLSEKLNDLVQKLQGVSDRDVFVDKLGQILSTRTTHRIVPNHYVSMKDCQKDNYLKESTNEVFVISEGFQTLSQIIVLVDKKGNIYVYHRNTPKYDKVNEQKWEEFSIQKH